MAEFIQDDWERFDTHGWDEIPASLWDQVTDGRGWEDEYGMMLYDMLFVDPVSGDVRDGVWNAFNDWITDEYGVDFSEAFDWEGWRSWYD